MKISHALVITTTLILNPLLASANESECPNIVVADVDGNGIVNGKDISLIAKNIGNKGKKGKTYYQSHDRDNNGVIDNIDVFKATRDMGKTSTDGDQEIAKAIIANTYTCETKPTLVENKTLIIEVATADDDGTSVTSTNNTVQLEEGGTVTVDTSSGWFN